MTDKMSRNSVKILNVPIDSTSVDLVLKEMVDFEANSKLNMSPLLVFTPNPEFLVEASGDRTFCELLNKSDINIPDGIGLVWASRILGTPIKERVSGADVVERLLEVGDKNKWVVGVVGARRGETGEVKSLLEALSSKYPEINFVNLDSNFQISNFKFQIVFACHGMKKQENWIWANKNKISSPVFMGVGGSLDFLTGFTRRAPVWIREFGLEWLWRGLQRPSHFKRIWKAVFVFSWLVVRAKLKKL